MADFTTDFQRVMSRAPQLRTSPGVATSLALAGADDETVDGVAGLSTSIRLRRQLESLTSADQRRYYDNLPSPTQEMLTQVGYIRAKDEGGRHGLVGLLEGAGHAIGSIPGAHAVGDVLGDVGHEFGAAGGTALHALGTPLALAQQGFRTLAFQVDRSTVNDPSGGRTSWGSNFSLSGFARAWRETRDGDKVFLLDQYASTKAKYDPGVFSLAERIARGEKPTDILTSIDDQATAQAAYETFSSKDFASAVRELEDAKISFGRLLADDLHLKRNTKPFHYVSGISDGLEDWYGDPLNTVAAATKSYRVAKYGAAAKGVSREGRILELFDKPAVRRFWDNASEHLATLSDNSATASQKADALGTLTNQYRNIHNLVGPMVQAKVRNADEARDFLTGAEGYQRLLRGQPAYTRAVMPTMSRVGQRFLATRENRFKIVNWLEKPIAADDLLDVDPAQLGQRFAEFRGVREGAAAEPALTRSLRDLGNYRNTWRGRTALAARRLTSKVVTDTDLYLADPDSWRSVETLAGYFAPKQFARQTAAAYLAADTTEARRRIVKGLYETLGEASGINQTSEGRRWLSGFLDNLDDAANNRTYSPGGFDKLDGTNKALHPYQLTERVSVPDFRKFYAQAARVGVMDRIGAASTVDGIDIFMSKVFKPGVLLRPALVFRNAGEEIVNYVLREGAGKYLRARGGLSAMDRGREPNRIIQGLLGHLPEDSKAHALTDARSWFQEHTTDLLRRQVGNRAFSTDELRWLDEYGTSTYGKRAFARGIGQAARDAVAGAGEGEMLAKAPVHGGRTARVRFVKTGAFEPRGTENVAGAQLWAVQLQNILDNPAAHSAVLHLDDRATAVAEMARIIEGPEYAAARKASSIYKSEGAEAWASRMFDDVRYHLSSPDGTVLDDLVGQLVKTGPDGARTVDTAAANFGTLSDVENELRPEHIIGQQYMPIDSIEGWYSRFVTRGFESLEKWTTHLSKQPIFYANYLDARKDFAAFERELAGEVGEHEARRIATNRATDTAIEKTLAFTDNPAVRSQFSTIARNFIPFWRAQEEFYTRWATTFRHSPESFRKAQLIFEGFNHSGMVHRDGQGNAYFVYPGTGALTEVLRKGGNFLGFDIAKYAVPYELRGEVRFLNQGLDPKNVYPSAGPILAMPIQALARMFPELAPTERAILGDQAAGQNPIEGFLPTPVRRALKAFDGDERSGQMASATRQAMAYLEWSGNTPPDDATAGQIDAYKEQVKKWARSILAMRVLYGMAAPAAPETGGSAPPSAAIFDREGARNLKEEFNVLRQKLGPERALALFIKNHGPDASVFTVSASESRSGAFVPATANALHYIEGHKDLLKAYPNIGAFLIPHDSGDFNPDAYRVELANGIRSSKSVDEFYRDLKISGLIGTYFGNRKIKDEALLRAKGDGNTELAGRIREGWSTYSTQFQAEHPLFAEWLSSSSTRDNDRQEALRQLRQLLTDPTAPQGPTLGRFRSMVSAYDQTQAYLDQHNSRSDLDVFRRQAARDRLAAYMKDIAGDDDNALGLYNRVFRYLEEG